MRKFVAISIARTWENCQRTRFYVTLTTDEGFSTTPACYSTGHVHRDEKGEIVVVEGLPVEEALRRALHDADDWSDLLQIPVTPYVDPDGVVHEVEFPMRRWTTRRKINERRAEKGLAPDVD